jgi:hypothetical protein
MPGQSAAQKMDGLRVANSLQPKGKTPLRKQIRVAPPVARCQSFNPKTPFGIGTPTPLFGVP